MVIVNKNNNWDEYYFHSSFIVIIKTLDFMNYFIA